MIIKVSSHKKAAMRFVFDNGNEVSIIFGDMTYSDNQNLWRENGIGHADQPRILLESTTVEVMVDGDKFEKWFEKKYEQNPAGWIPVAEIPAILRKADSKIYEGNK